MVACYLAGCSSGSNGRKTHLFRCPLKGIEGLKDLWLERIPQRDDKPWDFATCRLCYLHFEEHFVIKKSTVYGPEGEIMVQVDRKSWTLTENAVPTIFPSKAEKYRRTAVKRKTCVQVPIRKERGGEVVSRSNSWASGIGEYVGWVVSSSSEDVLRNSVEESVGVKQTRKEPYVPPIPHVLESANVKMETSDLTDSEQGTDDEYIEGVTDREDNDEYEEEFAPITAVEEENCKETSLVSDPEDVYEENAEMKAKQNEVDQFEVGFNYPTIGQKNGVLELEEADADGIVCIRRSRRSRKKNVNYDDKSQLASESESETGANKRNTNKNGVGEVSDANSEMSENHESDRIVHQQCCCVCKSKGNFVCCESCPRVFHLSCLDPPLSAMPEGSWNCFGCSHPDYKVDKILTWRDKGNGRELFVRLAGKSYWQCEWVSETQLKIFQSSKLSSYYKKYGRQQPPNWDQGDARRLQKNQKDPLEIRFYQFGVRPEWLRIHRIIQHRTDEDSESVVYLVKWQQLGYDDVTWEDEHSCKEISEEFHVAARIYHEWLNYFWCDPGVKTKEPFVHKHITIPTDCPVSNLKIKLQKQPEYIPKGMVLHEYQLEGLNWLRYSWASGVNTILGDEMGLGKTIQTIVFLNSLVEEGHSKGPFLICAPISTLLNWEREFEAWAPDLYVVSYVGDPNSRKLIRKTEFEQDPSCVTVQSTKIRSPVKFHVLLTSYQFPSKDAEHLGSVPWEMIIIDEGHRLKDDRTLLFKDLMLYSTSYKLLLTGTPLQNNLEELFNLLNFLCPKKFKDTQALLIEFEDIAKEDQIQRLHTLLGPHFLRRMKADVLKDMPSKSELIVRVELSPMQKQYSKHILTKNFDALNVKGGRQTSLLNVYMDLRKVCNHPYLFSKASTEAPEDPVTGLYELEAMTNASGKLLMLRKMLARLKQQGHRVLIFSQMATMLNILEEFLFALGYSYERIDGSILGSRRQDAIDRFNAEGAEQFVFLLSTKAGGLGINLATADTVIIFDSDWNPHNDIQAFSRAHRIGQKNRVMIYRFVTRGSVEEKIAQVCKKKMMLTHLVVRPEVGKSLFSKDELEDIVRFGTEELFKDQDSVAPIYYTDEIIETILDRTKEEVKERNDWTDDYFQGFNVASCQYEDKFKNKPLDEVKDPDKWKSLLQQELKRKEIEVNDLKKYGKGMRKKAVKYVDLALNKEVEEANEWRPPTSYIYGEKRRNGGVGSARDMTRNIKSSKKNLPSKQTHQVIPKNRIYNHDVGTTREPTVPNRKTYGGQRKQPINRPSEWQFVPRVNAGQVSKNVHQIAKNVDMMVRTHFKSSSTNESAQKQKPRKKCQGKSNQGNIYGQVTPENHPSIIYDGISKRSKSTSESIKEKPRRSRNGPVKDTNQQLHRSKETFTNATMSVYPVISLPDEVVKKSRGRPRKSKIDLRKVSESHWDHPAPWEIQEPNKIHEVETTDKLQPKSPVNKKQTARKKTALPPKFNGLHMTQTQDKSFKADDLATTAEIPEKRQRVTEFGSDESYSNENEISDFPSEESEVSLANILRLNGDIPKTFVSKKLERDNDVNEASESDTEKQKQKVNDVPEKTLKSVEPVKVVTQQVGSNTVHVIKMETPLKAGTPTKFLLSSLSMSAKLNG